MIARAFMRLIALVGLILSAPLRAVSIVAIKLGSRSPVLFVQDRIGLFGRPPAPEVPDYYIKHLSLLLDLGILFDTAKAVMFGRGDDVFRGDDAAVEARVGT